jgi:hypothetical protein
MFFLLSRYRFNHCFWNLEEVDLWDHPVLELLDLQHHLCRLMTLDSEGATVRGWRWQGKHHFYVAFVAVMRYIGRSYDLVKGICLGYNVMEYDMK